MLESVGCRGLSSRRMRITELARRLAAQEVILSYRHLLQAPAAHRILGPFADDDRHPPHRRPVDSCRRMLDSELFSNCPSLHEYQRRHSPELDRNPNRWLPSFPIESPLPSRLGQPRSLPAASRWSSCQDLSSTMLGGALTERCHQVLDRCDEYYFLSRLPSNTFGRSCVR